MKNETGKELRPEFNYEKVITPSIIKSENDSLREEKQIPGPDSLLMEKRRLKFKEEMQSKDSLNGKTNRIIIDSTRIK